MKSDECDKCTWTSGECSVHCNSPKNWTAQLDQKAHYLYGWIPEVNFTIDSVSHELSPLKSRREIAWTEVRKISESSIVFKQNFAMC